MPLQALGYAGFGSAALDDWRQFGTGLVGLQAVERGTSLLAFRMDDRKQRIVIDRAMAEGERFFGWEVADAAALDALAARLEKHQVACRRRTADAGRRQARRRADFVSRSGRQSPGGVLRRRDRRDAVQSGPFDFRFPHRTARPRPRRADGRKHRCGDAVLCRRARLRALRLHPKAVPRLFLSRQCAASFAGADRDRQERHASSDGGTVFARRCRPVLRHRLERSRSASASRSAVTPTTS